MPFLSHKKPAAVIGLLAVVIIGIFIYSRFEPAEAASEKSNSKGNAAPITISVATATKESVPVQITSLGTVIPYQTVAVKSRLDSVITEVKFHDGDNVKAGDVLFVLDDRALKTQYDEAKGTLARDQVQLNNLRQKFDRNKNLSKDAMAISQEALTDSRAAVDAQAALVQSDKAALDNLAVQITYTQITAPIDGRTGTINITAGNTVKSNDTTALVTIHQIHPILVQMSLPQQYFDVIRQSLANGKVAVSAKREKSNEAVVGELSYIDNTIDSASGTFAARAVFKNENETLWPGMLANLSIAVGATDGVITVPEVAVQESSNGKFIYVVSGDSVTKTNIEIDRLQNGKAVISKGLNGGEQVATDGMMSLKDGAKVRISDDKPTASQKAPAN